MNKKIQELIEKRAKAWEGAKAFVESKKDSDGLLSKEDVETYNMMEEKVKNFTFEMRDYKKWKIWKENYQNQ